MFSDSQLGILNLTECVVLTHNLVAMVQMSQMQDNVPSKLAF